VTTTRETPTADPSAPGAPGPPVSAGPPAPSGPAGPPRARPGADRPRLIRARRIFYGPFARFADWYHGWRDGQAGIPPRPDPGREPPPKLGVPRKIVTTAHREALIRWAQGGFTRERERLERAKADAEDRLAAILVRRDRAEGAISRAEATLAEIAKPLTPEERLRRRFGEEDRPESVVVQRRLREQQRRVSAAQAAVDQAHQALAGIEAQRAATAGEIEQHWQIARTRILRIHLHAHRRLASYRRSLIRAHPYGAWVNDAMGITQPELPLWGFPPPPEPGVPRFPDSADETWEPGPDDGEDQNPIERIPVGDQLVFGSDPEATGGKPFYYVADAAPRHFILTRDGDTIRLHDYGHANGLFIDTEPVRDARLGPGAYFDFFSRRYQVSEDGSCLEVSPLFPAAMVVYGLDATTKDTPRLSKMSFVQQQRHMLAILGPSGAGKTSLFSALVGELRPESGELFLGRLPLRTHGAQIRERLGFVPQDETLFRTFTVRQLLRYSYELRKGTRAGRDARVDDVCRLLEIDDRKDKLVGTLSGGQRKRASIAVEMLNKPSLLMLDEPTSGLDAGMDMEVLKMLRAYAETGNTVMVITHSTEHLSQAHRVLVVAKGGRPVYYGSARSRKLLKQFGVDTYAELMKKLNSQPDSLAAAYQRGPAVAEARAEAGRLARLRPERDGSYTRRSPVLIGLRQFTVLLRRQVALVYTRGALSFSARGFRKLAGVAAVIAPLLTSGIGAVLAGLVSGSDGLRRVPAPATRRARASRVAGAHASASPHARPSVHPSASPHTSASPRASPSTHARLSAQVSPSPHVRLSSHAVVSAHAVPAAHVASSPIGSTSAATALSLLITLAMLTGQSLTYSDIVNDYLTIRREHRTGTFTLPVLTAKWLVFGAIAVIQALLVTWIYVVLRPAPSYSLLLGHVTELFADLAAMSLAAMTLGLLISVLMRKLEQAIAVVTGVSIAQIALNGVASNLSSNHLMNAISMIFPSRWGLAAAAASVNLRDISPTVTPDALWRHTVLQWTIDVSGLFLLTVAYFLVACYVLARRLNKPD
jgi:ABC transport system ATP-binding/permease protein